MQMGKTILSGEEIGTMITELCDEYRNSGRCQCVGDEVESCGIYHMLFDVSPSFRDQMQKNKNKGYFYCPARSGAEPFLKKDQYIIQLVRL